MACHTPLMFCTFTVQNMQESYFIEIAWWLAFHNFKYKQ